MLVLSLPFYMLRFCQTFFECVPCLVESSKEFLSTGTMEALEVSE